MNAFIEDLSHYTGIIVAFFIVLGAGFAGALGAPVADEYVAELFGLAILAGGVGVVRKMRSGPKDGSDQENQP